VAKLSVTVDLLLGNIPERTSFLLPGLKAALAPYLQLAQVFLTLQARVADPDPHGSPFI
jgi:26S proteasome regulatory subunit N3